LPNSSFAPHSNLNASTVTTNPLFHNGWECAWLDIGLVHRFEGRFHAWRCLFMPRDQYTIPRDQYTLP
jgi:hypothetical protein